MNINSIEGREILNYYTNSSIDFFIGGNSSGRNTRSQQEAEATTKAPAATAPESDPAEEEPEKCIAMRGTIKNQDLTPIKQSAKSVAQLYGSILTLEQHSAVPQVTRIAYHLLGKNKQAKKMLINERGKQKLCEAVRNQYNNLDTSIIQEIEKKLDDLLQQKLSEEEQDGGRKMEYKQDEDFIELSDKLGKVTRILVNSYNSEVIHLNLEII